MQHITESLRNGLESCRVTTWHGSTVMFSTTGWTTLMVVTDARLALDQLSHTVDRDEQPDVIIWPSSMTQTPELVPEILHSRSLFDVGSEITLLLPSAQANPYWLNDLTAPDALATSESSKRWQVRADRMIDLGDVLH